MALNAMKLPVAADGGGGTKWLDSIIGTGNTQDNLCYLYPIFPIKVKSIYGIQGSGTVAVFDKNHVQQKTISVSAGQEYPINLEVGAFRCVNNLYFEVRQ